MIGPRSRSPSAFRISDAVPTSSTGSAVSETRMVSPIPSDEQRAHPDRALDRAGERRPRFGDAEVERVRHLRRQHPVGADHRRHVARLDRDLEVAVVELLEQLDLLDRGGDECLAWSRCATWSRWRGSEPELAPIRIGMPAFFAAFTTSSTLSGPPMFPGLIRTAATPQSIAFSARRR